MQILNDLQKLIQQIPHTERVLAKKWIQRLSQPVLFAKEQKLNDKYVKVLETQIIRLQQKKQLKLEYPLNLMPLDTMLTDIPQYIMKKFIEFQTVQRVVEQQPHQPFQTAAQHIQDSSLKVVDDELNELLESCHKNTNSEKHDYQISIPAVPTVTGLMRSIKQDEIRLTRSKYADISISSPQRVTEIAASLESEKRAIGQQISQIQSLLSGSESCKLELSGENKGNTVVHMDIKSIMDSQNAPKSKFFSQLDNSFVVDYEQTPYQKEQFSDSVQFINQNSSYGRQSSVKQPNSEDFKIIKRKQTYDELVNSQESNKMLFSEVQQEVIAAQSQYLMDRVAVLENKLNEQDDMIQQFFQLLE